MSVQSASWHPRAGPGLVGIILLALLAACAPAASSPPAKPTAASPGPPTAASLPAAATPAPASRQPLVPPAAVRVGDHGVASNGPLYLAQDRGYYQEDGLEVEFVPFTTGPAMMTPLATSQLDVALGSTGASLFNAIARDIPLRIVADKGSKDSNGRNSTALVARRDLVQSGALLDYADLRGKRIAHQSPGSTNELQLANALRKGGLTLADVERQTLGNPDMLLALSNQNLDAAILLEPFVARAVEQGSAVRWKGAEEFYPNSQQGLVFYGPSFLSEGGEPARRFMVAYVKGLRDYMDTFEKGVRRAETIATLQKFTDVKDAATYDRMVPTLMDRNAYVDVRDLEYQQQFYLETGSQQQEVNLHDVVDHQYVEYALGVVGRAPEGPN